MDKRCYFDNAATSFPKPAAVIEAVADFMKHTGGNPGRGSHPLALAAAELVYSCREEAAALFETAPERVIFTSGATHALNLAIRGLHTPGRGIVLSDMEHNAVRRPVLALHPSPAVFDTHPEMPPGRERDEAILASVRDAIRRSDAGMLIASAASNICSLTIPIGEIGRLCRSRGVLFIVDGAQAAGSIDIRMQRDSIDCLCLPGHKGLWGPMGVGMLILGPHAPLPSPLLLGGSGADSRSVGMPALPPERLEAGTLPVPAIAGLLAGLRQVKAIGPSRIRQREVRLGRYLKEALGGLGIPIAAALHPGPTVLFHMPGMKDEEAAALLGRNGFCLRAGLHCAPMAHDRLSSSGGIRASLGFFNTGEEIDSFIRFLKTRS